MGMRLKSENILQLDDGIMFIVAVVALACFFVVSMVLASINLFFGIGLAAVVAIFAALMKKNSVTLDKTTGKMTARYFSFLGSKKYECLLSEISKIYFSQEYSGTSSIPIAFLGIALEDGTVMGYHNIVQNAMEAQQIASFLGVPLDSRGPQSALQATGSVKMGSQFAMQWTENQKKMREKFERGA